MEAILFILTALVTLGSALLVITRKQPISSVMYLVLTFFCLAMLYVMLGATFLAAMQVIVYAGAIMVLFIFVVMMLNTGQSAHWEFKAAARRWLGYGAAALVLVVLTDLFRQPRGQTSALTSEMGSTAGVGEALFSRFVLPFEVASVLLLGAIIGVVALVKREPPENNREGEAK